MSSTKKQNQEFGNHAKSQGYKQSSYDENKFINGQGKTARINTSGQSFNVNGTNYSTSSGAKKSTKW